MTMPERMKYNKEYEDRDEEILVKYMYDEE